MTRHGDNPGPGWPFDDDTEGDRADRQATLALAMALDRARKRMGQRTMARLRSRWRKQTKPEGKGG